MVASPKGGPRKRHGFFQCSPRARTLLLSSCVLCAIVVLVLTFSGHTSDKPDLGDGNNARDASGRVQRMEQSALREYEYIRDQARVAVAHNVRKVHAAVRKMEKEMHNLQGGMRRKPHVRQPLRGLNVNHAGETVDRRLDSARQALEGM
ncbi:hypothetical protein FVE85_8812 [Porphyridium purpureum]|uniref:Transmembrane protein n=1 Tax=Porphyridium purpureum TaxID=35688 RepID=A0A5J4YSF6_PORPP|nr:hypothetical protein FVE85_8812 [Porphyridium purpureum]|eukprot:POR6345..scf296_7